MEVHVRNVPQQSTENILRNFLKPYFATLSIQSVHCQKPQGKNWASLTFLHLQDAEKFLSHHGQAPRAPQTRQQTRNFTNAINLRFLGMPIYCEKSRREANPYLLRCLAKEEKERDSKPLNSLVNQKPKVLPVTFACRAVACGVWSYVDSNLVFEPQIKWAFHGTAKFGEHSIIMTSETGLRIDFRYLSILCITTEDSSGPAGPVLNFSMCEPPRFYQKIQQDVLIDLMSQLGLHNWRTPLKKAGPDRHRLPSFGDGHQQIAGSCLVYRVTLQSTQHYGMDSVGDRIRSLLHAPEVPKIFYRRVYVHEPRHFFVTTFSSLIKELSNPTSDIPFVVKFQVQKLAQGGYLPPLIVLKLLPEIKKMLSRTPVSICVRAIRKLFNQLDFAGPDSKADEFELGAIVDLLLENECKCVREEAIGDNSNSSNVAIIHRAKVTPTGIILQGPEAEANNRVLRKYPDHHEYFLRVQFCDEDGEPVRYNPRISNEKIYHERFKGILEHGMHIAGRVYSFLGFSHSSLRAQSCWFMAPFIYKGGLLWDRLIVRELGNFDQIRSPAKCAARIGQAFSDTRTAVTIDPSIVKSVPDVQVNDRVFSDGVGTMSHSVMRMIWDRLPKAQLAKPTVFQIRYQGAKGMISLDSKLPGDALILRPSMIKFDGSESHDIEICEAAYKPLPMYLNRQFIKILEDMGVKDSFFLDLQAQEVQRLRKITESPVNAANFLKRQSIGNAIFLPWLISKLAILNLDFRRDGFLRDIVEMTLLVELRLLKHKTRILVEKGWHLHGLMDETGFLEEGEIYCSVTVDGRQTIIKGKNLVISRAPALHPGDVQLATGAVPPPGHPLLQISNCICFSSKGERDLPSQLSGGDLDGDRYYIMWDKNARPTGTFAPADYPRLPAVDIGKPVAKSDMTDHFIKFMETDQLGRIAVLHRVLADQKVYGTLDPDCITLAEMHSTAVDFSKTGIPVDMTKTPKYIHWRPDFEAPGPHVKVEKLSGVTFVPPDDREINDRGDEDDDFSSYRYYESNKVLGKLYRAIDESAIFGQIKQSSLVHGTQSHSTIITQAWTYVQSQCRLIEWKHHLLWARDIRDMYEEKLLTIMQDFSGHPTRSLSELEAFVGNILGKTGAQSRNQRELSTSMKEKFEEDSAYIVSCIVKDDTEWSDESLERSIACLAAGLEERHAYRRQEPLLSFKYVAAAVCLREVERHLGV